VGEQDIEQRLSALERRVRMLEDHLAILQLVYRWGPAVDTGSATAAGELFADDGILESDLSRLEGPSAVVAMVESDGQRALIDRGCAHVQTAPIVVVDGDAARATAYSQVYLHAEGGHEVWRVSANQWDFRRTAEGWRVVRRANRVIDGGAEARAILARALHRS
jgi:ketosteroid isomerase-like protein